MTKTTVRWRSIPWSAAAALVLAASTALVTIGSGPAGADTTTSTSTTTTTPAKTTSPATLLFEGGSFAEPIMNQLLIDDTTGLGSVTTTYFDVNVDVGRQDFSSAQADVAVTELPLTSTEATAAAAAHRGFAYVPIAASGVALSYALICNQFAADPFCTNLQLTALQVAKMYTGGTTGLWSDPQLATVSGGTAPVNPTNNTAVYPGVAIDPSGSNLALEQYVDGDAAAKPVWEAWLAQNHVTSTTPTDTWPSNNGLAGGDLGLANTMVPIDPNGDVPYPNYDGTGSSIDVGPLPVDWLGPPRNIPSFALQNAKGDFVLPTKAAETAALGDATMDPATNLVSFPASGGTDAAAYPLMVMSYLLVPTTGLDQAQATALAQFIRFTLSSSGQTDITDLGAIPPTPAMIQVGETVANQVAAEANPPNTTTTTTTASGGTTTTVPGATGGSGSSGALAVGDTSGSPTGNTGQGSGGGLAFTGTNVIPLVGLGGFLAVGGFLVRRRLLRARDVAP